MERKQTRGKNKKLSLEELVDRLIVKSLEALAEGKVKVTVADLIRMRELRKDLAPEPPVRPPVTWIDG